MNFKRPFIEHIYTHLSLWLSGDARAFAERSRWHLRQDYLSSPGHDDRQASGSGNIKRFGSAMKPLYVPRSPGCSSIALGRPERLGGQGPTTCLFNYI